MRARLDTKIMMRLKNCSFHPYTVRLTEKKRSGAILEMETTQGQKGYGDLAPLPGWSLETLQEALQELQAKKKQILKTRWTLETYLNELKRLKLSPSLSFALESALSSLLCPHETRPIEICALLTGTLSQIFEKAALAETQNIRSAKLKISQLSMQEALQAIDQLKTRFFLRIDVNKAWSKEKSLEFFSKFPLGTFDYVEEPFENFQDLATFPHPLAIDESFPQNLSLQDLEKLPTLKALIYKPTLQGGLGNCLPLYKWAQEKNIAFVLSCSFESDLGLYNIATLASRLGSTAPTCLSPFFYLKDLLSKNPPQISNGFLHIPHPPLPKTLPTSVAGGIFSPDRSQILLIQRRDVPVWVLPGGGIDLGETPEEAIIREMKEETGYIVTKTRLVGDYSPINRLARQTQVFECVAETQETLTYNPECKQVRFFPLDGLPHAIPPPYPEWIADALEQKESVTKTLVGVNYKKCLWYILSHPILVLRFLLSRLGWPINS